MILSCSACSTRYLVDPAVLGPDGREVRCAKCGHQWLQMPPADAPKTTASPQLAPEIRAVPQEASADAQAQAETAANLPAISRGPARRGSALAWTLLVIVIGIFVGGFAARNEIAEAWPPAARLYESLGLRPSGLGAGIELRNVGSARQEEEGGGSVLVVQGEVANVSSAVRQVPKMRASLRAGEREVQSWTFQAVQSRLLPGETAPFLTRFKDPSPEATNLTITFTEDN